MNIKLSPRKLFTRKCKINRNKVFVKGTLRFDGVNIGGPVATVGVPVVGAEVVNGAGEGFALNRVTFD